MPVHPPPAPPPAAVRAWEAARGRAAVRRTPPLSRVPPARASADSPRWRLWKRCTARGVPGPPSPPPSGPGASPPRHNTRPAPRHLKNTSSLPSAPAPQSPAEPGDCGAGADGRLLVFFKWRGAGRVLWRGGDAPGPDGGGDGGPGTPRAVHRFQRRQRGESADARAGGTRESGGVLRTAARPLAASHARTAAGGGAGGGCTGIPSVYVAASGANQNMPGGEVLLL